MVPWMLKPPVLRPMLTFTAASSWEAGTVPASTPLSSTPLT